mgnify:FL=1
MHTELARLLERVRQRREALTETLPGERRSAPGVEERLGCAYRQGDHVFDVVSGQEGNVVSSTIENLVVTTPQR